MHHGYIVFEWNAQTDKLEFHGVFGFEDSAKRYAQKLAGYAPSDDAWFDSFPGQNLGDTAFQVVKVPFAPASEEPVAQ